MLPISIPNPCHEKWSDISPVEQGVFCGVCSRIVIDFTTLNDDEVKNYFLIHRGQRTCGRFRNDQITNADNSLSHLLASTLPFWKKFLAIVVIVFSSFLTGCNNDNVTTGVIIKEEKPRFDTLHFNTSVGVVMSGEEIEITTMGEKENTKQSLLPDTVKQILK